ncbi:M81 family metallopeptidase [Virgibacillus halophilus]|uniref:M81 family metallopeptidase n=1 Tax=Tigheibacillus halophilus TaxID=361280 RepID=UPI003630EB95
MKVVVGGLYHESNTFNPFSTSEKDFVLVEGEEMLNRVESTSVFKKAGFEIVPSIHAFGLSSGMVTESAYRYFADKLLAVLKNEKDIDGIWLHLHGAMTVERIGSGELQLLKEMREIVGYDIPISLALDIHGNNAVELEKYVNIVRAYRTVPHTDQGETEAITARLLVDALNNGTHIIPAYQRVPMIIGGETALGNAEPMKSIFAKLEELETIGGISTASFFIGFSWADTVDSSASVFVIPESEQYADLAKTKAEELAEYVFSKRYAFTFDAITLKPEEAIDKALAFDKKPVFISDSGDNTTGGAVGINTILLELLLKKNLKGKKVCLTAIFDEKAFEQCNQSDIGDEVSINLGVDYDESSKSHLVKGVLKAKGDLLGYLGATTDKVGEVCTISVGDLDIVVANSGESFITVGHFSAAGLNLEEYDVIFVKQGYLFPELSKLAALEILALTPGATYQLIEELDFKHIPRPCFPLEKDFQLHEAVQKATSK